MIILDTFDPEIGPRVLTDYSRVDALTLGHFALSGDEGAIAEVRRRWGATIPSTKIADALVEVKDEVFERLHPRDEDGRFAPRGGFAQDTLGPWWSFFDGSSVLTSAAAGLTRGHDYSSDLGDPVLEERQSAAQMLDMIDAAPRSTQPLYHGTLAADREPGYEYADRVLPKVGTEIGIPLAATTPDPRLAHAYADSHYSGGYYDVLKRQQYTDLFRVLDEAVAAWTITQAQRQETLDKISPLMAEQFPVLPNVPVTYRIRSGARALPFRENEYLTSGRFRVEKITFVDDVSLGEHFNGTEFIPNQRAVVDLRYLGPLERESLSEAKDFDPDQPRDWHGRWVRIAGLLLSVTPGKAPLNLHRTATPPTWPDGTQYSHLPKALRDRMDVKVKDTLGVDLAEMTRNVTEAYHSASREDHDQGEGWYENALADCRETQRRLHDQGYDVPLQTIVAAYANMSPQTPWENNVVWADHVLARWSQNPTIDDAFMSRTRSMDDVRTEGTTPHRRAKRTETLSWWLAHEISLVDQKIAEQDQKIAEEEDSKKRKNLTRARDRLQERRDRLQDVLDGPPRRLSEYPVDVQATLLRLDGQSGDGMQAVRLSDSQDISANYTMDSNIENTLTLLYGPNGDGSGNDTRNWISAALADGHKVRSFYNDILTGGASTAVTIDTHALDVAVLGRTATRGGAHLTDTQRKVLKSLTSKGEEKYPGLGDLGVEGAYAEIAEAFRLATDMINSERAKRGLPPLTAAQVQAVVWITGMKQKKGAA